VAVVTRKLLVMAWVLRLAPALANRHLGGGGVPRLTEVLPKVKTMMLLTARVRILMLMPKVKPMRCDEGYSA
jgi:steroid 5-alpha reductase family enzyme